MKLLITIMVLIPIMALGQNWDWDSGASVDSLLIADITTITCDTIGSGLTTLDLCAWTDNWVKPRPVEHDTLTEYITDIGEVCDTLFAKKWMPFKKIEGVQFYRQMTYIDSVICHIDTTWANKRQVWLEPDQYEKLIDLLK